MSRKSSMFSRYPVKRTKYTQTVGKLLPDILKSIFLNLGASKVITTRGQTNGVDIKVWSSKGKLVIVGEVINWSINSLLSEKRRKKMINNLNNYNCNKILVYTNLDKNHLLHFSSNGISQINIGYQILPTSYFNYYQKKGQVINRKAVSPNVIQEVEKKVKLHLKRRNIRL